MSTYKLKPCPFCGGDASIWKRDSRYGVICFVKCDICGAQTRVRNCDEPVESNDWSDREMSAVSHLWNVRFDEKE